MIRLDPEHDLPKEMICLQMQRLNLFKLFQKMGENLSTDSQRVARVSSERDLEHRDAKQRRVGEERRGEGRET
jgi:hypothetical protein